MAAHKLVTHLLVTAIVLKSHVTCSVEFVMLVPASVVNDMMILYGILRMSSIPVTLIIAFQII